VSAFKSKRYSIVGAQPQASKCPPHRAGTVASFLSNKKPAISKTRDKMGGESIRPRTVGHQRRSTKKKREQ